MANEIVVANQDTDVAVIQSKICLIRDVQVMLDRDLAKLYGVEVKHLNRQVKRNAQRFPSDFMFQLSKDELEILKCQFGTSSWGGDRRLPYAFTESGIAMLSGVLHSDTAIDVNIRIMRAFVAMRRMLIQGADIGLRLEQLQRKQIIDQNKNDERFSTLFDTLDRAHLLPSGLLLPETEFDALRFVTRLVESAKKEIVLIDPYSDASTLEVLAKKTMGVKVRLVCKATNWGNPSDIEIAKFNKQYKGLIVDRTDNFHDRFVIIDGKELYNFGSSVNSLGRRLTTYSTRDPKEIGMILAQI